MNKNQFSLKMDRNTRILVTGGGGVLGKATLRVLTAEGFNNILTPSKNELNLLDPHSTDAYFHQHKPQAVIHLASVVFGLGGNIKHQMLSALENTQINNNLFSALTKHTVDRIFFAGTVASYPFPYVSIPLVEEQFFSGLPHYGEFGYAMAKRHAYTYLQILSKESGLRFTYGIFTNLYGEEDKFDIENGHVIPSLIAKTHKASLSKSSLLIWGDGNAQRDFLHAEDAAKAVLKCLESSTNQLINISSGNGISIREVAETLAEFGGISELKFDTEKPIGIPKRIVDNTKLKALGFTQSIDIRAGLARTYKWYISNIEIVRK